MASSVARWLGWHWAFLEAPFAFLNPKQAPVSLLPPVPRPLSLPLFDACDTFTECWLRHLGPILLFGLVQAEQI